MTILDIIIFAVSFAVGLTLTNYLMDVDTLWYFAAGLLLALGACGFRHFYTTRS